MGRFTLDELECDEIHAAVIERRADLNKRKTKLLEDGLPEAAEGIDKRLRLYDSHDGPDGVARAGLVRLFAPQRDIESDVEQQRRTDGQQDIFGGGAETGGAPRTGSAKVDSSAPGDNAGDEIEGVDYEVIPQGRRLAATSTLTIESALAILEQIARVLKAGPAHLDDAEFDNYATAVVAVVPAMNPGIDPEHVRGHVLEELRAAEDNAHGLAHYVERNVALIRDLRDNPPAPKAPTAPGFIPTFKKLTDEERDKLDEDERAEYDEELAEFEKETAELAQDVTIETPLTDAAATALRGVVFPPAPEPAASTGDEGLSFETPSDRGETKAPEGGTNAGEAGTKPAAGETAPPAEPDAKGKGKGKKKDPSAPAKKRGRNPKGQK